MKKIVAIYILVVLLILSIVALVGRKNVFFSRASQPKSALIQITEINRKLLSGNISEQELKIRNKILTQELEENPALFVTHILPEKDINKINSRINEWVEKYESIKQGNIFTVISEDFNKNKVIKKNFLKLPDETHYEIIIPRSTNKIFSNQRITFTQKNVLFNDKLIIVDNDFTLSKTQETNLINQSVAVVLITFGKVTNIVNPNKVKEIIKDKIFNLYNPYSVNSYYKTLTRGSFYFNTNTSTVTDWISLYDEAKYPMKNDESINYCKNYFNVLNNYEQDFKYSKIALQKVQDASPIPKKFDRYIFIFSDNFNGKDGFTSCFGGIAGRASYRGNESSIFVDADNTRFSQIVIHEIGHNLFLDHAEAGYYDNGDYKIFGYADGFDPMGNGPQAGLNDELYGYLNGLHQVGLKMNLLDFDKQIVNVKESSENIRINFLDSSIQDNKMIRVIQKNQQSDEEFFTSLEKNGFFIECQKYSTYNQFPYFKNQKGVVLIRKNISSFNWGMPMYTLLIDIHPQTTKDFSDAFLTVDPQDYYFDPTSSILVKLVSIDQSGCYLSIKYDVTKPQENPKLPYLEPSPSMTPTPTSTPIPTPTIPMCGSDYPCPSNWYCNGNIVPGTQEQGSFILRYCTLLHN